MIEEFIDNINDMANDMIMGLPYVPATEIGLDHRSGKVYVGDGFIAVKKVHNEVIRYYGGFEYVDAEFVVHVGNVVFYLDDDGGRVTDCLETYEERESGS